MTKVDHIIWSLIKWDEKNPFKKTKTEIKKTLEELWIVFNEINGEMLKLLKNAKLKNNWKSDKEIIQQIEMEIKLLENNLID